MSNGHIITYKDGKAVRYNSWAEAFADCNEPATFEQHGDVIESVQVSRWVQIKYNIKRFFRRLGGKKSK